MILLLVVVGALLAATVVWVTLLVLAVGDGAASLKTRDRASRHRLRRRSLVQMAGVAAMALVPLLAAPLAEAQSGWSDPDGDGMYLDFVNGSYDWFDLNGGAFLWFVLGGWALVACTTFAIRWAIDHPTREPAEAGWGDTEYWRVFPPRIRSR